MQLSTLATLAAAALAYASPAERRQSGCGAPASYQCDPSGLTIDVCDWDGVWKPLVPGCPTGTACVDNAYGNGIPYCLVSGPGPVVPPDTDVPGGACTVASQYSCYTSGAVQGIQICDLAGTLQNVGACPNYCAYIAGIPYCY